MTELNKKDQNGKIRYMNVFSEGENIIRLLCGKKVENRKKAKKTRRNIEEQAFLEAESIIRKNQDKESIKEAEEDERISPMLAKEYQKESKLENPIFLQPKLDGMRCLAYISKGEVTLVSRMGETIQNLSHIKHDLSYIKKDMVLDGELYCPSFNFQETMSCIKRYQKGRTEEINFYVYDIVRKDLPFEERLKILQDLPININVLFTIKSQDIDHFHKKFLNKGYEGTIIRQGTKGYECNKRSNQLLKRKDFLDLSCPIIDVIPSGALVCKMSSSGKIFNCSLKFSHEERKDILKNKKDYIGQIAEIRFFEYSSKGIPRFPVCHGFRL